MSYRHLTNGEFLEVLKYKLALVPDNGSLFNELVNRFEILSNLEDNQLLEAVVEDKLDAFGKSTGTKELIIPHTTYNSEILCLPEKIIKITITEPFIEDYKEHIFIPIDSIPANVITNKLQANVANIECPFCETLISVNKG